MFNDTMLRLMMIGNRNHWYRNAMSVNRVDQLQLLNIICRLHILDLRMRYELDMLFRKSIGLLVSESVLLREGLPTLVVWGRTRFRVLLVALVVHIRMNMLLACRVVMMG